MLPLHHNISAMLMLPAAVTGPPFMFSGGVSFCTIPRPAGFLTYGRAPAL